MADFLITSLQPWDLELGSNARDMARELARRGHRVLFASTPLDLFSLLRGKNDPAYRRRKAVLLRREKPLRQIAERLWAVDIPRLLWPVGGLPARLFDRVNRVNNRMIAGYLRRTLERLGWNAPILLIDNDIFRSFWLPDLLPASRTVYYRRDNLAEVPYWQPHGSRLEPLLAAKCDCVLANSEVLAAAMRPYNAHSYDIGQGVDLSAYDPDAPYSEPDDLRSVPGPVIGYAGYITALRLDLPLLVQLARERPGYSFVFVGPEDAAFRSSPLHELPNCYFPGNRAAAEVPRYIAAFDVCINPQLDNPTTVGNYPRKVDEYLALGKPVVATETATMHLFDPEVALCRDAAGYRAQIDACVARLSDEKATVRQRRIDMARSHSWAHCVDRLCERLELPSES